MLKLLIPTEKEFLREAAERFAGMYFSVTGRKPEIIENDDESSDLILFGSDAESPIAHDRIMRGTLPPFRLRTGTDDYQLISMRDGTRNILFLAGGSVRAFFYAVYDFFERAAGCHYFWDGDVIPKQNEIPIEGFHVFESPRFEYRGLRYFAHRSLTRFQAEHWDFDDWKKEFDWILKKRLNLAMLRIGVDDLFQKAFPKEVPYPDWTKKPPEAVERSYDDRTLFWPLEYRGELRRKVLAYGRKCGLLQPEDCGTMTHWYSRTPKTFLNAFHPDFMPQCPGCYGEENGLVWDIRKEENLERYWKLTETHIREYGSPEIFHTIGLAERNCYPDRSSNQKMKVYTYRRIIGKLREHYPHAPLLIGTWDMFQRWEAKEVRELLKTFDPANTILFDYTSDCFKNTGTFRDWDVIGKFPWIFGIFHAYESSNEPRGMYERIEERLPVAAADSMCKGVVFWPENSHQDTLMLDFFPSIAWNPENPGIENFIPGFCQRRYASDPSAGNMEHLWKTALPLMKLGVWGSSPEECRREIYPDLYFTLLKSWNGWAGSFFEALDEQSLEYFRHVCLKTEPLLENARQLMEAFAEMKFEHGSFRERDILDLSRTVFSRSMSFALAKFVLIFESWRNEAESAVFRKAFSAQDLEDHMKTTRELAAAYSDLLESSEEYSLRHALDDLRKRHPTNPDFEATLKGNAENFYCRSSIYELARFCYERELDAVFEFARERVRNGCRSGWNIARQGEMRKKGEKIENAFYARPLAEMAPDVPNARKRLPDTWRKTARIIQQLSSNEGDRL